MNIYSIIVYHVPLANYTGCMLQLTLILDVELGEIQCHLGILMQFYFPGALSLDILDFLNLGEGFWILNSNKAHFV